MFFNFFNGSQNYQIDHKNFTTQITFILICLNPLPWTFSRLALSETLGSFNCFFNIFSRLQRFKFKIKLNLAHKYYSCIIFEYSIFFSSWSNLFEELFI